jgi:hypothetical protein
VTLELLEVEDAKPAAQPKAGAVAVITPTQLLQVAVERGATIEQIERLYALKMQVEADEARNAFNTAFAAFKAEAVQIVKSKKINDGPLKGKLHADLWDVVVAATQPLAMHGLSTSWRVTKDEPNWIEVTCTLKHAAGHSEAVALGGEPDTGPGRNKIQSRGSTITYLQRYTLTAILGLAAREADDDGAGGASGEANPLLQSLVKQARETNTDADALAFWNARKGELAGDKRAYAEFKDHIQAHRAELKEAAQ